MSPDERKERMVDLALAIASSEAFMWLMCGGDAKWVQAHIKDIQPAWTEYKQLEREARTDGAAS